MAAPIKTAFKFFPLYVDLFDNKKIRKAEDIIDPTGDDINSRILVDKFLVRVYATIFKLGYYIKWTDEAKHKLCSEIGNGVTIIKLDRYISALLESNLLNKPMFIQHQILTSKGIQEEWLEMSWTYYRRKGAYIISEYNLVNSEETAVNSEDTPRKLGKNSSKQRKKGDKPPRKPRTKKPTKEEIELIQNKPELIQNKPELITELTMVNATIPFIINNSNNKGIIGNTKYNILSINNVDVVEKRNSEETVVNSEETGGKFRINSENDIKTNEKAVIPESTVVNSEKTIVNSEFTPNEPNVMLGFRAIEELLEIYFTSNAMIRTRELLAMKHGVDLEILRDWGDAFNQALLLDGKTHKTKDDWVKHFRSWLNLQDIKKDPKKLLTEQNLKNEQRTSANQPTKGHQPFDLHSAIGKIDKLPN